MNKRYIFFTIFFLIIYSITFGQDYPYFMDTEKQLEFESKRIYINEVNNKKMIISGGGDTYQFFNSLIEGQAVYKQDPIRTSYYYNYKFEIIKNGKLINEVEFLQTVGLNKIADDILRKYYEQLNNYKKNLKKYNSSNNEYKGKKKYLAEKLEWLGIIGVCIAIAPIGIEDIDPDVGLTIMAVGAVTTGIYLLTWLIPTGHEKLTLKPPEKPVLTQQLDNKQIISIAESYNRRIFEEIKRK